MTSSYRFLHSSQLMWGAFLLVIGTTMLLDNLGVLDLGSVWRHWPFLVVALGLGKFVEARTWKERTDALWWIFFGGWLYLSVFRLFGLGFRQSWPILLIGWGVLLVIRSLINPSLKSRREEIVHE